MFCAFSLNSRRNLSYYVLRFLFHFRYCFVVACCTSFHPCSSSVFYCYSVSICALSFASSSNKCCLFCCSRFLICSPSFLFLQCHRYDCKRALFVLGTPRWSALFPIGIVHFPITSIRNVVKSCVSVHSCRVCTAASHSLRTMLHTQCRNAKAASQASSKHRTAFPLQGLHAHSRHFVLTNAFPPRVCIFSSRRPHGIWHRSHCNTARGNHTLHRPVPHGGHAVFQLCILRSMSLCLCLLSSLLW